MEFVPILTELSLTHTHLLYYEQQKTIFNTPLLRRVVWVFGGRVSGPIEEVTPTHLTEGVLATLRQADDVAHSVLANNGESSPAH